MTPKVLTATFASLLCYGSVVAPATAQTLAPVASSITAEQSAFRRPTVASRPLGAQPSAPQATATPALPRVFTPTLPRTTYTRYPWKLDIMATVFWVGELPTQNNPTPNTKSSWDTEWTANFGGYDDPNPAARASAPDYRPAAFVPKRNPFYVALPYNDCQDYKTTKAEAYRVIPWFKKEFKKAGRSVCHDRWVAIRVGDRICYAQWSDCGPFLTDDHAYVFGNARPANSKNDGAGIDVSPAVRDYLAMSGRSKCDWRFVDTHEVPDGPWKTYGQNNHFVQQAAKSKTMVADRLDELRRQRDEWFRNQGAGSYRRR